MDTNVKITAFENVKMANGAKITTGNISVGGFTSSFKQKPKTKHGSGEVIKKEFPISSDIATCVLSGKGVVNLSYTDNPSLIIEIDDNLLRYISIADKENTLKISHDANVKLKPTKPIIYTLRLNKEMLNKIKAAGSLLVHSRLLESDILNLKTDNKAKMLIDTIKAHTLIVKSQKASCFEAKIDTNLLRLIAAGATFLKLCGKTEFQNVTLSNNANLKAKHLENNSCKIHAKNRAIACIKCKEITGKAFDTSKISLIGKPTMNVKTSGIAQIMYID